MKRVFLKIVSATMALLVVGSLTMSCDKELYEESDARADEDRWKALEMFKFNTQWEREDALRELDLIIGSSVKVDIILVDVTNTGANMSGFEVSGYGPTGDEVKGTTNSIGMASLVINSGTSFVSISKSGYANALAQIAAEGSGEGYIQNRTYFVPVFPLGAGSGKVTGTVYAQTDLTDPEPKPIPNLPLRVSISGGGSLYSNFTTDPSFTGSYVGTVYYEGLLNGGTTDANGKFEITVPKTASNVTYEVTPLGTFSATGFAAPEPFGTGEVDLLTANVFEQSFSNSVVFGTFTHSGGTATFAGVHLEIDGHGDGALGVPVEPAVIAVLPLASNVISTTFTVNNSYELLFAPGYNVSNMTTRVAARTLNEPAFGTYVYTAPTGTNVPPNINFTPATGTITGMDRGSANYQFTVASSDMNYNPENSTLQYGTHEQRLGRASVSMQLTGVENEVNLTISSRGSGYTELPHISATIAVNITEANLAWGQTYDDEYYNFAWTEDPTVIRPNIYYNTTPSTPVWDIVSARDEAFAYITVDLSSFFSLDDDGRIIFSGAGNAGSGSRNGVELPSAARSALAALRIGSGSGTNFDWATHFGEDRMRLLTYGGLNALEKPVHAASITAAANLFVQTYDVRPAVAGTGYHPVTHATQLVRDNTNVAISINRYERKFESNSVLTPATADFGGVKVTRAGLYNVANPPIANFYVGNVLIAQATLALSATTGTGSLTGGFAANSFKLIESNQGFWAQNANITVVITDPETDRQIPAFARATVNTDGEITAIYYYNNSDPSTGAEWTVSAGNTTGLGYVTAPAVTVTHVGDFAPVRAAKIASSIDKEGKVTLTIVDGGEGYKSNVPAATGLPNIKFVTNVQTNGSNTVDANIIFTPRVNNY